MPSLCNSIGTLQRLQPGKHTIHNPSHSEAGFTIWTPRHGSTQMSKRTSFDMSGSSIDDVNGCNIPGGSVLHTHGASPQTGISLLEPELSHHTTSQGTHFGHAEEEMLQPVKVENAEHGELCLVQESCTHPYQHQQPCDTRPHSRPFPSWWKSLSGQYSLDSKIEGARLGLDEFGPAQGHDICSDFSVYAPAMAAMPTAHDFMQYQLVLDDTVGADVGAESPDWPSELDSIEDATLEEFTDTMSSEESSPAIVFENPTNSMGVQERGLWETRMRPMQPLLVADTDNQQVSGDQSAFSLRSSCAWSTQEYSSCFLQGLCPTCVPAATAGKANATDSFIEEDLHIINVQASQGSKCNIIESSSFTVALANDATRLPEGYSREVELLFEDSSLSPQVTDNEVHVATTDIHFAAPQRSKFSICSKEYMLQGNPENPVQTMTKLREETASCSPVPQLLQAGRLSVGKNKIHPAEISEKHPQLSGPLPATVRQLSSSTSPANEPLSWGLFIKSSPISRSTVMEVPAKRGGWIPQAVAPHLPGLSAVPYEASAPQVRVPSPEALPSLPSLSAFSVAMAFSSEPSITIDHVTRRVGLCKPQPSSKVQVKVDPSLLPPVDGTLGLSASPKHRRVVRRVGSSDKMPKKLRYSCPSSTGQPPAKKAALENPKDQANLQALCSAERGNLLLFASGKDALGKGGRLDLQQSDNNKESCRGTTSTFRGVSKHKLTKRWEASLWVQRKQLYLGGYDSEVNAARAYDIALLCCKGLGHATNFPPQGYDDELKDYEGLSQEAVVARLRRQSSAFSRGKSKYRGVSGQDGRWEARIGTYFGRKNVSFGIHATEEEAARQYDKALIIEKGAQAKTNFCISKYIEEFRVAEEKLQEGARQNTKRVQLPGGEVSRDFCSRFSTDFETLLRRALAKIVNAAKASEV